MKKSIALLLALVLLLAIPACAEEALYMRELPQYTYIREKLLTWESYPEVRIAPYSTYNYFTSYNPVEPVFLSFPGPENALVSEFDVDYVAYLDEANAIQYSYQVKSSDSFEEFLNKATDDAYILLDGSGDVAAYINPDNLDAYGMIATREFEKSSKLVIRIKLDGLSNKMPLDTIVTALSEAIVSEVTRVNGAMHYEAFEQFWNYGEYAGIKFLDTDDFDYMLKLTFPKLVLYYEDGSQREENFIVTQLRFDTLHGVYNYGDGAYVEVEIDLDDNPFALYKMNEDNDVDAQEITLSNGKTWYVYMSGLTERGNSSYCYASTPLGHQNQYGNDYYLTLHFDAEKITWGSYEDLLEDLALFDANYEILSAASDPYVPTDRPAVEAPAGEEPAGEAAPESADSGWICPDCGAENAGNFCANCGAARPVSAEWVCPNCGSVNDGKFCPNCGTAKPEG